MYLCVWGMTCKTCSSIGDINKGLTSKMEKCKVEKSNKFFEESYRLLTDIFLKRRIKYISKKTKYIKK